MPVHQMGLPCDLPAILADRRAAWPARGRGCRLRDRQRDPRPGSLGANRPAARDGRLFLVPPAQGDHDRRRRDAHDPRPRARPPVPSASPARHERCRTRFAMPPSESSLRSTPILGFNYRMTDIQAAVGRVQLGACPSSLDRRVRLARRYAEPSARSRASSRRSLPTGPGPTTSPTRSGSPTGFPWAGMN